jgi:gamma-glutamyl:cysteine ligase YbdK (ATP-grasp superfamily)
MGKNVLKQIFDKEDFEEFTRRVQGETTLLQEWCKEGLLAEDKNEGGFELEMWLLNDDYKPASNNLSYINSFNYGPLISEASHSCIEANLRHEPLNNKTLKKHHECLKNLLSHCQEHARKTNQHTIAIGTLPTATSNDFNDFTLTDENRYHAINNRLVLLRDHLVPHLHIEGNQILDIPVDSFSLVGAISSYQIHFQISQSKSARFYNASVALSAPMVALSANSPFMFGCDLWEESRIPFYERILETKFSNDKLARVTFGSGYIKNSLLDLFNENCTSYSPLLPQVMDVEKEAMSHLQLHNGNIYRWNRPILDFDQHSIPHFRVEHRPLPSGPSAIDMIANAAFYFGISYYHTLSKTPLENEIPFNIAESNFYEAAKNGLSAKISWCHGEKLTLSELILKYLLPQAKEGLKMLDIDEANSKQYLSIIEERVRKKMTGSQWQKDFFEKNNRDFTTLVSTYIELQQIGDPVHDWPTE